VLKTKIFSPQFEGELVPEGSTFPMLTTSALKKVFAEELMREEAAPGGEKVSFKFELDDYPYVKLAIRGNH
jgi:hypothetical protein